MIPTTSTPPDALERCRRLGRAAGVALFAAVLVLPPLGAKQIVSGDEARFALLAQDMLARGTWFDARVREQPYRNKPPMYPWAIRLLSLPGGRVTETTAQAPIVAATLAAVFFTTLLGQQMFGRRAGVWAGLVLTTSYAFFAHSQILLPDMLVVAFGVAALCAFWAAVSRPPGARALVAFYVLVALGVFAKGPMGLLPLLVAIVWLLTTHGVRGLRRLVSPPGVLAFAVVTAAWLVPFLFAGSRTFAENVVVEDWLSWYLGGPSPARILNFWLETAKGLMPWTTLVVLPLLSVRRQWRDDAFRLAFVAWLVPFVVMMLSQNQRTRYLLPTYPAAALLVAWWVDTRGGERSRAVAVVVGLSGVGVLAALAVSALPWTDPLARAAVDGFWWKAAIIAAGGIALAVFLGWALPRRPAVLVPGVAAGMAVLLAIGVWIDTTSTNRLEDYRALAALVERHAQDGEVGITGGRFFSIDFYLGRPLTPVRTAPAFDAWLARPDRPIVVVSDRAWDGGLREQVRPAEVVGALRVRSHIMYLVRGTGP
ncbi:MAG TPA: glycosyltransferase family 39 protein [Methylomirabilota bacterium]|nr:glycosyltransferase family 39 protein [Methylomirabilota bacterium]